jgi:subtilisin family serine protease
MRLGVVLVAAAVLAIAAAVVPSGVGGAQTGAGAVQATADAIPGEYIVSLTPDAHGNVPGFARSLTARYGGDILYLYDHALTGFAVAMPDEAAAQLSRNPNVVSVVQNGAVHVDTTQISPPWGLDRIDEEYLPLDGNYDYVANGAGVRAYIIDTGIRTTHTQFGGRASIGTDTVGDGQNGNDCNGHGTHVSGTVAGSTYGVAKGASLIAVRVLNCSGSGSWAGVIAGIDWVTADHAAHPGPAVANMSLGGGYVQSVNDAVARSTAAGVTYAIAAGNSNANACNYSPSSTPSAITVAATTSTDARASYSNIGPCVDVFAPGSSILSAWNSSDTATNTISGTSMATPHVTGVAALYLSLHPAASPSAVSTAIVNNAVPGVVNDPGTGSPNRLLYSPFVDGFPPTTTTTTTTTSTTSTTTTTTPLVSAPGAPQNLTARAKKNAVQLSWQAPSSGGAPTGYKVYRGTSSSNLTFVATLNTSTSFNNTGLTRGVTYFFQVSATNSAGEGPRSATVSAKPN